MFKTILVATDGSAHARRAVEIAARLAVVHDARLIGLHVIGNGDVPPQLRRLVETEHLVEEERLPASLLANVAAGLSIAERGVTEAHLERLHAAIGKRIAAQTVTACRAAGAEQASCSLADGDPAQAILKHADLEGADLIVMGTRGLSGLKELLMGSVSHRVCQGAECSCLTVK